MSMTSTMFKAFVYEKHILLNLIVIQVLPSYNLTIGKTIQMCIISLKQNRHIPKIVPGIGSSWAGSSDHRNNLLPCGALSEHS